MQAGTSVGRKIQSVKLVLGRISDLKVYFAQCEVRSKYQSHNYRCVAIFQYLLQELCTIRFMVSVWVDSTSGGTSHDPLDRGASTTPNAQVMSQTMLTVVAVLLTIFIVVLCGVGYRLYVLVRTIESLSPQMAIHFY